MDESFLYQRIAEAIRTDILEGRLQAGERLPSIRELTKRWNCTPGTVQRAYQELARQGLVVSQAGRGTRVPQQLDLSRLRTQSPLRQAGLVNRAEAFLLEVLTAGFDLNEIQLAFNLAMDRWRAYQEPQMPSAGSVIRFSGSHDMALIWLAGKVDEILPGTVMQLSFNGSLGGLMSLAEGKADLVGTHLLDAETGEYNLPYIRRLFPGQKMRVTRLAYRRMGLMVAAGNPLDICGLEDLVRPGMRFVNRQAGSGTRVWLDAAIEKAGLNSKQIAGYGTEKSTHSEVARAIAEGKADAGLGLESAAAAFHLDFLFLLEQPYDLVALACDQESEPFCRLLDWLVSPAAKKAVGSLAGYDARDTGLQIVV
ncbi:MAG TPA: substrate-binding domain-containing protein [Anaerolineaceae bacterium]|nr:substrate-binding domain-containing protein [Anaerolineaceae bacterium]